MACKNIYEFTNNRGMYINNRSCTVDTRVGGEGGERETGLTAAHT